MNFQNLSPAERLKASVLAGLIVIVLFVVAHALLGALSPKKPAAKPSAKAATTTGSTVSAPAGAPAAMAPGADGFTGIKLAQAQKSKFGDSPDLDMGTHDPFVPLPDSKPNGAAPTPPASTRQDAARKSAPDVSVKSSRSAGGSEFAGGMAALPGLGPGMSPAGGSMGPAAVLPPPEPSIRVVGIVHGDPSVATIQVANRTLLARPGDVLHTGYRLLSVGPEAVVIRCKGERVEMRVGATLNEQKADGRAQSQP